MAYEGGGAGNIILEARRKLTVTGVEDVESFDEETITMRTQGGTLVIRGEGLHIDRLSLDSGEVMAQGRVDSLEYEDTSPVKEGFFARLLH